MKKINQIEPLISESDVNAVSEYLQSGGWITEHKVTEKFEKSISEFCNRRFAVAVPNGTIAIYLALLANNISEGKRVAVPNITMIATINAIIWAKATPVLIDVDETLCMSYEKLSKEKDIDAVIFVPLNGRTGSGEKIENFCLENKITLIEDSAHALGSEYETKKCGSLGDSSIFSFTPHKIITMGQGGLVLVDNEEVYTNLIKLKTFNREADKSDLHDGFGLNFKITDLQASLGLSQFSQIENFISIKKKIFENYFKQLNENYLSFINFNNKEVPWFIDVTLQDEITRSDLSDFLLTKGIATRNSYPSLSSQKYLKNVESGNLDYSIEHANRVLWLPSSLNLTNEDIEMISEYIQEYFIKSSN